MDKTSFYAKACIAKPLKKFLAYCLDFFISLILLVALFATSEAILNSTPFVLEQQERINDVASDMFDLVIKAKVGKNKNGTLASQDEIIDDYIKGITLSSLKHYEMEDVPSSLDGYMEMNEENDYCYFYYVTFKTENQDSFLEEAIRKQSGIEYYGGTLRERSNGNIYLDNGESKTIYQTEGYPYLTESAALAMSEYYRNDSYQVGERVSNTIHNAYETLLKLAVSQFQESYQPYLELNDRYEESSSGLYQVKDVELILSYLIALAFVYILFPLLFKEGRTPSLKILKLGVTNTKDERIAFWNILVRYLMNVLIYGVMLPLTGLIYFSTAALEWIGRSMVLNISFLSIGIFSLFAIMFSFIFSLVLKKHQNFEELVSFELCKDGKEFIVETKEVKNP